MGTEIRYEQSGPIGRLTFVSPNGINLLSVPLMVELEAKLTELRNVPEVRVLILTGEGKTFIAGADIAEMSTAPGDYGRAFSQRGQRCMNMLTKFEHCVTIAAINGPALGGGCEVALACDLRVMAEDARIGFPEVKLGLIPGWGGTQRAFALMGPARARHMLFTGEHISGRQAADYGLVNEAVAQGELLPTAERLAKQILSNGPGAVRLAKRVFCTEETSWLEKGLAGEAEAFGEAFLNDEAREGLRAFLEKRQPSWSLQEV